MKDRIVGCKFLATLLFLLIFNILHSYPEGWSDDILISPDIAGQRDRPDIITDSECNVWAVWDSAGWSGGYIYYTKRDSMGNCLIPEAAVSTSGYSRYSRIEVDAEDNIHFVWRELSSQGYGLGYAKTDSNGTVLVPSHLAVSGAGGGGPIAMEIAIDAWDDIHVIWEETPSNDLINYTLLDNNGDTLVSRLRVSPPDTNCHYPGICVDNTGNNHICYRCDCPPTEWLTYTKVDKYGNVVVPYTFITEGESPSIVCDVNGNVHVVYYHLDGSGNRIYYLKLDNGGNVIISPTCISLPADNSWRCHLAIDSDQYLHAVWSENRSQQSAWIICTKMDTSGNVFIPPLDVVFPPHTFWAIEPRVAVDSNNRLHVVWIDGRIDTVARIFYKRGENETGTQEIHMSKVEQRCRISISPNPFSERARISFALVQEPGSLKLEILDSTGRVVRDIILGEQEGFIYWDGTDEIRDRLPAGVYFLRVSSQDGEQTIPIVLLK